MEALSLVEILCIVAIIFLSVVGVLLTLILLKIKTILMPFTEMVKGYQNIKEKADIVSQVVAKKIAEKINEKSEKK